MIFAAILLAIVYIIYIFLIKGLLWKIIIGFSGWLGLYALLITYFPNSTHIALNFSNYQFSYAFLISLVIFILAAANTKTG